MQISLLLMQQIAQLFLVLLMGYAVVKTGLLKASDSKVLSVVFVYLVMPCVVLNAFQIKDTPEIRTGLLYSMGIAVGMHVVFLLLNALFRKALKLDAVEQVNIIYSNAAALVIPIVQALLGEEYVVYSCAFVIVQLVLLWTHASACLQGSARLEWRKLLTNVNLIAIAAGAVLYLLHVSLPAPITSTLSSVGNMIGPMGMLLAGMKEEKRQFTVLLPLGDLAYDEDFLQKAKKIKGIKEIWPVIEVPVVIKIEDYTETTTFSGIDMNAFGKNPTQNELGKMPLLLLGNGSLRDMKDYNNHAISKKQQEKFLEMGENLNIFYSLDEKEKDTSKATDDLTTLSGNSARGPQTSYMPCKAAVVIEGNEIYIPISQAQDLCREIGEPSEISKVYLKINGKNNLETAKKILSGI